MLLVVGSFLPWAGLDAEVVDFLDLDATASGWSTLDGEVGDGPIFLVLAIALAVFGILALRGVANLGTKIAAIVVAALALVFALAEFGSVASENDDFNALGLPGIEDPFTYEYGLFVLAAGAVIALVGAILQRRRPRTTPSPY